MLSTTDIDPLLQIKLTGSSGYVLSTVILGSLLYGIGLVFYRLSLHPLSKIPGPQLAAATYWYEFYQDVILGGHYVKDYPKLHAKYGPVVRVTPNRVHVSESEFYDEIYHRKTAYLKDPKFALAGGISESLPMLIDPEIHRKRRKLVNPMFASNHLEKVAPLALQVIKKALGKAVESHRNGEVLHIQRLYTGITIDIIMQICFDKQLHLIDSTEEEPPFLRTLRHFSEGFFLTKHLPFLTVIAARLPNGMANILVPGYAQFRRQCAAWIEEVKERHKSGKFCTEDGRKTLFDRLLCPSEAEDPSDLPPLTPEILIDEAYAFCFAGTHTLSIALSLGTYYLLGEPVRCRKLVEELKKVPRNADGLLEYHDVCGLPYLTLVSMSARMVHDNSEVFPEPDKFIPERWIGPDARDANKSLVVFSKGPRACIGLNLAWMEMYLTLSNFFSRFDMSLWKTDEHTTQWGDCGALMLKEYVKVKVDGLL
ncbi:MAG: hypothetical protein Q9219_003607 [cf. Caloplaca sp. 3 TL-2023]